MTRPRDVIVIGAGVFGCSVAYALARAGATVTLLDAHTPGRATSASAGGLWAVGESLGLGCGVILHASAETGAGEPEPLPRVFMDFLVESNRRFPALARELESVVGIDIEAESDTGLLYLLYDESEERHATAILEWLGPESSLAELWPAERVRERDPLVTADLQGAVHFPGDNQVNPMLLTEALKRGVTARGGRFVPEARVTGFRLDGDRIVEVETTRGPWSADVVVNAAGAWGGRVAKLAGDDIPVFPVRGQVVCTEALERTLHSNLTTANCYLLQKAHGEILIGSTTERTEFDAGVEVSDLGSLARGAIRAVPALADVSVKRTWAGLRPGTPDELPLLGPSSVVRNLFHATGGFRTGIVAAPLSGEVVAASVLGEAPPVPIEPFLPSRFEPTEGA